jgi:hypothetical protein
MQYNVTLEARDAPLEQIVEAETSEAAANWAMKCWLGDGEFGVDSMPADVVVTGGAHGARRFRFEPPPAFILTELRACSVCGCTDDRACDPPCAWVDTDLCSNPDCVAAAELADV